MIRGLKQAQLLDGHRSGLQLPFPAQGMDQSCVALLIPAWSEALML